ncbi:MAG TPA: MoxR family ATPase, partial [Thermoleophilaceae bacterium]|nr:MoxR family ATPase [Thermoleophilaceae bacterium]
MTHTAESVEAMRDGLESVGYLAGESTALVSFLAAKLGKPVLVEGPAGVGKTELAKALSRTTGRKLIRLQCYEGLDEAKALYEWNYRKQLLRIQAEATGTGWDAVQEDIFGEEFLLRRPLLQAIAEEEPVVLLIDEIDKTDQEFEAMLLELLSDFQITIPELGRIEATTHPGWDDIQDDIFGAEFLLERPLMTAIAAPEPVVLLIDEIDKTDQEFEAMLLELLSDFQISIPELGVIEASSHPLVLLTSNNSRELTEALKR